MGVRCLFVCELLGVLPLCVGSGVVAVGRGACRGCGLQLGGLRITCLGD